LDLLDLVVKVLTSNRRDEFLALLGPLSHGTLRTELVDVDVSESYVSPSTAQRVNTTA
jgi:hypothetical protein